MQAFTHLVARTRCNINGWKATALNSLDSDINKIETDILSFEKSEYDIAANYPQLLEMYAKYAVLQRKISTAWAQRTRLIWASEGDKNSSFFHNTIRIRKHFNFISQISNLNGNVYNDHSGIKQAFLGFYTHLWSNSSNENFLDTLHALPDDLPKLSPVICDFITREVTREEIYKAVLDLPSGKSLGPDGLNAEFYHFYWTEVGDYLVSAVQFFFSNSIMPSA